jgi:hypothetical protein
MAASLNRIQSLWRHAEITLDTLVWTEGMAKRARLRAVPSLRAMLEASASSHLPSPAGKENVCAWAEANKKLRGVDGADDGDDGVVALDDDDAEVASSGRRGDEANGAMVPRDYDEEEEVGPVEDLDLVEGALLGAEVGLHKLKAEFSCPIA